MATLKEKVDDLEEKSKAFVTHEEMERRQSQHEEEIQAMIGNMSTRIEGVERAQAKSEPVLASVDKNVSVILDRMERGKGFRIEIRDWIIGAAVIAGPIIAVLLSGAKHG